MIYLRVPKWKKYNPISVSPQRDYSLTWVAWVHFQLNRECDSITQSPLLVYIRMSFLYTVTYVCTYFLTSKWGDLRYVVMYMYYPPELALVSHGQTPPATHSMNRGWREKEGSGDSWRVVVVSNIVAGPVVIWLLLLSHTQATCIIITFLCEMQSQQTLPPHFLLQTTYIHVHMPFNAPLSD